MRRVLLTELRRGVAPLAFVAVAVIVTVVLFNELERWVGRWAELNGWVRVVLVVVGPVTTVLGAWFGGRERRRGIRELLGSTPRAPAHRALLGWGTLAVGTSAGLALAWAVASILVARIATYGGGPSWLTLAVAFVGVGTCSALGYAIGRLARAGMMGVLAAAVSGLAAYVLFGTVSFLDSGARWLVPSTDQLDSGRHLVGWASVTQTVFFVAVTTAALAFAAARRRGWALVPLAVAVGVAFPLARSDFDDVVVVDAAALAPVCAGDGPQVCTEQQLAFTLPDFEPLAREAMSTWADVATAPSRVVATGSGSDVTTRGRVEIWVEPFLRGDGSLVPRDDYGQDLLMTIRSAPVPGLDPESCGWPDDDGSMGDLTWEQQDALWGTATMIVGGVPNYAHYGIDENGDLIEAPPFSDPLWDEVSGWDRSEQVAWFEEYSSAAAGCRFDELAALARGTAS